MARARTQGHQPVETRAQGEPDSQMRAKVVVIGQAVVGSVVATRKVHKVNPLHQSSNPAISHTDQT